MPLVAVPLLQSRAVRRRWCQMLSCPPRCCRAPAPAAESSGKTTLALHAMAEVQKAGGAVALIDAEHAFDPVFAKVRKGVLAVLGVRTYEMGLNCCLGE